ncbi:MAG TPA: hypothetical protein PLT32_03125 [bacterium]|nr:hypothetical protein [bacterium]
MPKITAATDHTLKNQPHENVAESAALVVASPIWVSVSEAAKFGGIQSKTVRRAIGDNLVIYKVKGNRYLIDFGSLLAFLNSRIKLHNKLQKAGVGQYVASWLE